MVLIRALFKRSFFILPFVFAQAGGEYSPRGRLFGQAPPAKPGRNSARFAAGTAAKEPPPGAIFPSGRNKLVKILPHTFSIRAML